MEQVQIQSADEPFWSILARAADLLETDPRQAEQQAHRALKSAPGQQQALQLIIGARRAQGDLAGARAILESMVLEVPDLASIHYELGQLVAEAGENEAAIRSLSRVLELEPGHPQAWRALGDALVQAGDMAGAANAYSRHFSSSLADLRTLEQVSALGPDQAQVAENVLREYVHSCPTDLLALQMLGRAYMAVNRFEPAEHVFARALAVDPMFRSVRLDYATTLRFQTKWTDAIRELDILLEDEPDNSDYHYLKATALSSDGKIPEAVRYCEELIATEPDSLKLWLAYAYVLRMAGREADCVAAFQRAIQRDPTLGEAWWGLANLKTFEFAQQDLRTMRAEMARADIGEENRIFLHFALGKALEDVGEYAQSFEHYSRGNALIRAGNPFDAGEIAENVKREKQRFTREFFRAHEGIGGTSAEPIFILGMPRTGSTLVEQILASHSLVEGGGELPCINAIMQRLEMKLAVLSESADGDAAALFEGENLRALGEEYLERCRSHRRLSRPHFTDKMPTNFHHLGLICAILPDARIIDVRRHPLACCFSNFKQIFPSRRGASYSLEDIGLYYRGYVELMAHFDRMLPGRVHRMIYEDLVRDPQREIGRLLDYCGLPFEEQCLQFHQTDRGITTISSAQVRRPLYTGSVEQWRHYEPWLAPLKGVLGPVLEAYPAIPEGFDEI